LIPFIFFGYSIMVEFIQLLFIPGRSFDLMDILADALGCLIGFLFVKQYQRFLTNVK
jgi:VanZ family protein